MTVKQLILMLEDCKTPDAQVLIFDPNSEQWEQVTGCVYGGDSAEVKLYSDED